MDDFGKLILSKADDVSQEFFLNKPVVTMGRATTNDIVLNDGRVSRNHAEIIYTPDGITLKDLKSANGVWQNKIRITEAKLQPGDTFEISGYVIQYLPPTQETHVEATIINSEIEFEHTRNQMTVPVALNETSLPRLVIHAPDRTWEILLTEDSYSIGRTEGNRLVLDYSNISRNHAQIDRKGDKFILRDLQSTNGTRVGNEKIDQRQLQNSDTIQLGPVRLVYKSGFSHEELTVAEGLDFNKRSGLTPVIFVPGTMGSQLWLGSEQVWPNVNYLLKHPEIYRYSENDTRLKPKGILNEMVIVPNLISFDQYNILGDYLVEELGYERENNFIEFAYDWRQDVRQSARELANFVEGWNVNSPITLIAHSLGTLVSRYYVEKLGGNRKVGRLLLMGGPHQGVPKIAANLLTGVDILPFGLMGKRLTEIIETFPSCYQILPVYACGVDQNGKSIHFFEDDSWVKPAYRPMLPMAREFRRELGTTSSVPTLSIFGYGIKTAAGLQIQSDGNGLFKKITIDVKPSGDSSVPESSAVLPRTEIHPVRQYHGTLFNDNDVKMRLKLELLQGQ
ncbi:MAG TPA: FHA domain-containing protein [Anaerolineales bacterium]|nr:FHA domain-containing protein [Anaerolineales bacterium]